MVYVLDTFAILALLNREPGAGRVRIVLSDAQRRVARVYLSAINLGEVLYITERERGVKQTAEVLASVERLPIQFLQATWVRIQDAAHIKANFRVSYADAFAVAAAQEVGGTVLTADPEFAAVEHLVRVEWLPR